MKEVTKTLIRPKPLTVKLLINHPPRQQVSESTNHSIKHSVNHLVRMSAAHVTQAARTIRPWALGPVRAQADNCDQGAGGNQLHPTPPRSYYRLYGELNTNEDTVFQNTLVHFKKRTANYALLSAGLK